MADEPPSDSIERTLNEMWQEMTGTAQARLALSGVLLAAQIWHHQPGPKATELLHRAVEHFEASSHVRDADD